MEDRIDIDCAGVLSAAAIAGAPSGSAFARPSIEVAMFLQTTASDDVMIGTPEAQLLLGDLRVTAAWMACAEAGECARDGTLQPQERREYELQVRCALMQHPHLIRTYLGYLDLAILAGQVLQEHRRRDARAV